MTFYIKKKSLLFIEPYLSFQPLIHKAKAKGYQPLIISANDVYLTLPEENFMAAAAFFQVDTHNEAAVLTLVTRLCEKFKIEGVIPGDERYGWLTAKIATYLKTPGLNPEVAFKVHQKDFLQNNLNSTINTSPKKHIPQEWGLVEKHIYDQEYTIDGLINKNIISIISFTEKFFSTQKDITELGYIVRSEIDPIHSKSIGTYLQDVVSVLQLEYGPFRAKVKLSEKGPVLLKFNMSIAKDVMPTLIHYATGINYISSVLELFSAQPLSCHNSTKLNAGIIFFPKRAMKEKYYNHYLKTLSQNSFVIEVAEHIKEFTIEKQNICHSIFLHQDYETLKDHIKKITKNWNCFTTFSGLSSLD